MLWCCCFAFTPDCQLAAAQDEPGGRAGAEEAGLIARLALMLSAATAMAGAQDSLTPEEKARAGLAADHSTVALPTLPAGAAPIALQAALPELPSAPFPLPMTGAAAPGAGLPQLGLPGAPLPGLSGQWPGAAAPPPAQLTGVLPPANGRLTPTVPPQSLGLVQQQQQQQQELGAQPGLSLPNPQPGAGAPPQQQQAALPGRLSPQQLSRCSS